MVNKIIILLGSTFALSLTASDSWWPSWTTKIPILGYYCFMNAAQQREYDYKNLTEQITILRSKIQQNKTKIVTTVRMAMKDDSKDNKSSIEGILRSPNSTLASLNPRDREVENIIQNCSDFDRLRRLAQKIAPLEAPILAKQKEHTNNITYLENQIKRAHSAIMLENSIEAGHVNLINITQRSQRTILREKHLEETDKYYLTMHRIYPNKADRIQHFQNSITIFTEVLDQLRK